MRNVIQTAATIRNVFAFGQDAAIAPTNDKRYSVRSYHLNWASHSGAAHRAAVGCRRGLARWLKTAATRLSDAAECYGLALSGMRMRRQPVAPRITDRIAVR